MKPTLRLNGERLLGIGKERGIPNIHQVSLRGGGSYPTMMKYFKSPQDIDQLHLETLYSILSNGLGMTKDEINRMSVGELFQIVDH